jgi:nucleotide-binding universal stress UspA family protein
MHAAPYLVKRPFQFQENIVSYKTILVHVDHSRHAEARIRIAAQIAIAEGAHLIGAAMTGVSRYVYEDGVNLSETVIASQIKQFYKRAEKSLEHFDAIANSLGVLSFERRLVTDEPEGGLALQARYADLVVVSQPDMDDAQSSVLSGLPEYVMLNSVRPVLVIPYAGQFDRIGKRPLIAWDGSMEATRAVANAIPLLKRADNVTVAVFNATLQYDMHGQEPGADIALYLARHNVKVDVSRQKTSLDTGNALLSLAADLRSDLIVMGGYGHSRFREVLLGGVTLTVLKTMTAPVLMSH